jgi:hypothetical protein
LCQPFLPARVLDLPPAATADSHYGADFLQFLRFARNSLGGDIVARPGRPMLQTWVWFRYLNPGLHTSPSLCARVVIFTGAALAAPFFGDARHGWIHPEASWGKRRVFIIKIQMETRSWPLAFRMRTCGCFRFFRNAFQADEQNEDAGSAPDRAVI